METSGSLFTSAPDSFANISFSTALIEMTRGSRTSMTKLRRPASPETRLFRRSVDASLAMVVILLNMAEIILIARIRPKKSTKEKLLLSLSVADLSYGLATTCVSLTHIFRDGKAGVHREMAIAFNAFLLLVVVASILHILAINSDQLWAITAPLQRNAFMHGTNVNRIILVIWAACVTTALTVYLVLRVGVNSNEVHSHVSTMRLVIGCLILFADVIYLLLYAATIYRLKHLPVVQKDGRSAERAKSRETSLVLVCTLITFLFITLTAPYAFKAVIDDGAVSHVPNALLIVNSAVNSIVYFLRDQFNKIKCKKAKVPDESSQETFQFYGSTAD